MVAGFDFSLVIAEAKGVLTAPQKVFSTIKKDGGFLEPVLKSLVYGLVAGMITAVGILVKMPVAGGAIVPQVMGISFIITMPIVSLLALFIGGAVFLVISAICGGSTNYQANVRAVAALQVVYIVNSLVNFFYGVNFIAGVLAVLVVSAYGLWLFYNALVGMLGAKVIPVRVVVVIFLLLSVFSTFANMAMRNRSVAARGDQTVQLAGPDANNDGSVTKEEQQAWDLYQKMMPSFSQMQKNAGQLNQGNFSDFDVNTEKAESTVPATDEGAE